MIRQYHLIQWILTTSPFQPNEHGLATTELHSVFLPEATARIARCIPLAWQTNT